MRLFIKKILLLSITFAACFNSVQANNTPAPNQPTSNAVSFALQAGLIAGAAQACGQDPSVFIGRVGESIDKLALTPTDKVFAISNFQKAMQQARTAQLAKHLIPCSQVLQDFKGLPLMRDDYQQTVLSQLAAINEQPTTQTPVATSTQAMTPASTRPNLALNQVAPTPPTIPTTNIYAPPNPNAQNMNATRPNPTPPNPYTQTLPSNSQQSYQAGNNTYQPQTTPQPQAPVTPSSQPPPYSPRN